ncbi:MAG: hypothetical protein J6N92_06625 [Alloprevotella sp.]|nr:hypothetical protein [Alloprevotella sp.]
MKHYLTLLIILLLSVSSMQAQSRYDLNADGAVNVGDVTVLVNNILGKGGSQTAVYEVCPDDNHPHIINMGEAGLWLCCNLGSSHYVEPGTYFAWGDKDAARTIFSADNYAYYDKAKSACQDLGADISGTKYDVAMAYNPSYRTPTQAQFEKLLKTCSQFWADNETAKGAFLFSPDAGILFLPAGGFKVDDEHNENGIAGYYWTSSLWHDNVGMGASICVLNGDPATNYGEERWRGLNIRPIVMDPCDLNNDGQINVGDVTKLVNIILGKEEDESVDAAVKAGLCPNTNHPHAIDLGAAGKWACCNVDVKSPLDGGTHGYYAWGETSDGKSAYDNRTYTYSGKDLGDDISGNATYDAAAKKWGGKWAMPTVAQSKALVENCTYEWTTIDGLTGGLFTAANGNKIFLPAKGWFGYNGQYNTVNLEQSAGVYWTASASKKNESYAFSFNDSSEPLYNVSRERFTGLAIRPVIYQEPTDAAVEAGLCPNTNHPHAIDLGAAGKWACCNVGAKRLPKRATTTPGAKPKQKPTSPKVPINTSIKTKANIRR